METEGHKDINIIAEQILLLLDREAGDAWDARERWTGRMDGEAGRTEAILQSNIRSKDVDHGASWDVSPRGVVLMVAT